MSPEQGVTNTQATKEIVMVIITQAEYNRIRNTILSLEQRLGIVFTEAPPPLYTIPDQVCDCVTPSQSCPICRPAEFHKDMSVLEEELPY